MSSNNYSGARLIFVVILTDISSSIRGKIRGLVLSSVVTLVLTAWAAPVSAAYPQTITTDTPFVNLPRPSDDPRWAEAFSHWDKRADTKEVMKAIELFNALAMDKPGNLGPQMWLCRSYFIAAMRNRSEREKFASLSVAAGDNALAISPGNDDVRCWRFAAVMLHRDFTKAEMDEVRAFGRRYRPASLLPGMNDPLFKEAAPLWQKRGDKAELESFIVLLKKIEAAAPDRIEPKIWLSAAHYVRRRFETTNEGEAKWLKMGIDYAQAAIKIEPRNPAANYLASDCQGIYGSKTSTMNIARYALDIGKELQIVVEEDPLYNFAGFSRFFAGAIGETGSLVAEIARMLGFPEELILRATTISVNLEPDFLESHYYRATMLFALDRKEEAKEELLFVINADPAKLPDYESENRYIQDKAQNYYK